MSGRNPARLRADTRHRLPGNLFRMFIVTMKVSLTTHQQAELTIKLPIQLTGRPRVICTTLLVFLVVSWINRSEPGEIIKAGISNPLNFNFRNYLGKGPALDPDIRIFALDDTTVEYLQNNDLTLTDWGQLLKGLAESRPAAIYIDKLFGAGHDEEEARAFRETLHSFPTPVVNGSYFSKRPIPYKQPLPLDKPEYDLERALAGGSKEHLEGMDFLQVRRAWFYGPHPNLYHAFRQTGHIVYGGAGRVPVMVRIAPDKIIPHLTMLGGQEFVIEDGRIRVNGHTIPTDASGRVLVNLIDTKTLWKKTLRLKNLIAQTRAGNSIARYFKPGQRIVILPGNHTGGTDFLQTPVGVIPGGFIVVSLLNSMLKGEWLVPLKWHFPWFLAAAIFGAAFGILFSPIAWLILGLIALLLITISGLLAFSYASVLVPWFFICLAFTATSVLEFSIKMQRKLREKRDAFIKRRTMHVAAMEVHRSLIPPVHDLQGIETDSFYSATEDVGGDWYGIYQTDPHTIYAMIGDVSGHGFSSALLVGAVSGCVDATLSMIREQEMSIPDGLRELDEKISHTVIHTGARAHHMMTMAMVGIDLRSQRGYYMNRGHTQIMLLHKGQVSGMLSPGSILGHPGKSSNIQSFPLVENDILFFYTDGLVENCGPDGRTMSIRTLRQALTSQSSVQKITNDVLREARAIWKGQPNSDDISFFSLRISQEPLRRIS